MNTNFKIINPATYNGWDNLILNHRNANFFHSSFWAKVLRDSYRYTPQYFSLIDNGELQVTLPLFEVSSVFTGRRGVSLPFTDYCYPLIKDDLDTQELFDHLILHGKNQRWRTLELRDRLSCLASIQPSSTHLVHTLHLSEDESELQSRFRSNTRRNIRKALKEGVEVKRHQTLEAVREFCALNSLTRREHGLPPQPFRFFKNVFEQIISKGQGFTLLAYHKRYVIAGAVFLHFGDKAIYKYGASDRKFQHLRPNNLIMWEAIKHYSKSKFSSLCFGKTAMDNPGLLQFKSGFGTEERKIHYYKYDLKLESFIRNNDFLTGFHNRIFSRLPIPALNLLGSIFYRHIG